MEHSSREWQRVLVDRQTSSVVKMKGWAGPGEPLSMDWWHALKISGEAQQVQRLRMHNLRMRITTGFRHESKILVDYTSSYMLWGKHDAFSSFWRLFSECPELFMTLTFAYSSILAITSLTVKKWSVIATRYNIVLLLVILGTYTCRDIWPLATYTQTPKDASQGNVLWFKIAILVVTAALIPLFVPRRYIPVDPKAYLFQDPMPVTNDEQTCSIFALIMYTYLDPIIFLGYRVPHLKFDQLPPLSDTDYSKNLTSKAFPHLDPFRGAKRRHLFFGLMRVFRKEFTNLALLIICRSTCLFAFPIAIYHILSYLETGGNGTQSDIRPWFWILCMFLGPAVNAVALQWYIFILTRTLVRTEALLTQLVFEHSLRIRLKAESSSEKGDRIHDRDTSTMVGTPDTVSISESSAAGSNADEEESVTAAAASREASGDAQSSQFSTLKGKAKDTESKSPSAKPEKKGSAESDSNLIGKINNLVTTDWSNIVEARDFLLLLIFVPLHIALCTTFLYQVLGWRLYLRSAFVGLASMILLFPLPGYIAKLVQDVQRTRIKMTDARVQDVTEAVNVLRMIKLFGWEGRMAGRIKDKRDDELAWLWKLKTLEALNGILNFFIPTISMVISYATYTVIMKEELSRKVSLDRVHDFLQNTELLDSYTEMPTTLTDISLPSNKEVIGFNNATFSWSLESQDGSLTPMSRNFRLRIDGELLFKSNCINLIVGPTGSGKTSMLMALLGEMHFIRSTADSWFNLPRERGVAYAAQESWVQNETIRKNILFGSPYDAVRYRKVIRQCALEKDLELFEAGDQTEVGEKGLTLRFARVTLARAIYSQAKIILLDDVLAALDVHTSAWIVDKCFRGDLVKGRTILLVTHNLALATPVAKFIISIGQDGSVQTEGTAIEEAVEDDPKLAAEAEHDREALEIGNEEVPSLAHKETPVDGKLIVAEEIAEGHVTWKSLKLFLTALGGDYPLIFFSVWMTGFLLTDWVNTFQVWFLGYWGSQYESHPPSEVKVSYYLTQYSVILFVMMIVYTVSYLFFIFGSMRASMMVNSLLIESVLGSTLRWLDETPTARMITRCTQDIRAVDGPIPQAFAALTETSMTLITKIGVIIIFTPPFFAPGLAVAGLGFYLGNLYLKARLSVKRELSGRSVGAANTGFSLNMAIEFCTMILWWVRIFNDLEVQANSLERIQDYIDIEHEPKPTESGKPPAAWPTSGELRVENLSARYSQTGPTVLHDLSFHIKSGERVGIVGRTGSGKSSLTLALLRCIVTEGTVYYDGIPTNTINLDALRSNITIIPQTPELLSGLFTLQEELDEARLTLDSNIATGGANLSVGQRQILALARAMVRGSKLLILDEATSAIGMHFHGGLQDRSVIQATLRQRLASDVTIITVAHRLQTIMDADKITELGEQMVLDAGRVAEFDTPTPSFKGREACSRHWLMTG
ncbi:hypothetical protein BDZ97DRAFT_1758980 [Flammula alnicola]|nr:hypothetical protein BDZ97DRAFT_1758980 [Flammula alnicola]